MCFFIHYIINSLKFIGKVFNLLTFNLSKFVFKSFKPFGTLTNLLMPNLSTSSFKAIKSFLAVKLDLSAFAACSNFSQ